MYRSVVSLLGRELLRDIALVCLAVGLIGMSYGAIAVGSGLPFWVPMLLSVTVLAGASELLFTGIVAAGGNPLAAAAAGLLVNARHMPYGLAVNDVTGRGWRRLMGSHVMNDESVSFALAQSDPARKRAAYWTCGIGVLLCWPAGAALGALLGSVAGDTDKLGLDATFPTVLLSLVLPGLRERSTARAALVGAVVALATTPWLPAGLPMLLALSGLLFAWPARARRVAWQRES